MPTLLVGLAYAVLAILGFRAVEGRRVWWAAGYVGVQLALGFAVFSLSGAAVGAVLLLVVLVAQSVLLLPLPAAIAVAAVLPLVHLGMQWPRVLGEALGTLAVSTFTLIVTELLVRERRARAELAVAHERLRGYTAQAEQLATIQERNRLARDIHDGVGHHLTVVQMLLEAARAVIPTAGPDRLDAMLANAQDSRGRPSPRSGGRWRRCVSTAPSSPTRCGSSPPKRRRRASRPSWTSGARRRPLRADVDESLFRAAQEGLTNVRKHADATRTAVVLDFQDDDHVRLEVRDDGRGLAGQRADGFGLAGLRERMASIGGHLSLRSTRPTA